MGNKLAVGERELCFPLPKCWFERNNELTSLSSCTFKAFKGFQLPHSLFQKGLAYKTVWLVNTDTSCFKLMMLLINDS